MYIQGEVTPIGAVSRAATGVKMRSNGQGTFWGSVIASSPGLPMFFSVTREKSGRPGDEASRSNGQAMCWGGTTGDQEAWSILLRMRN